MTHKPGRKKKKKKGEQTQVRTDFGTNTAKFCEAYHCASGMQ